MRGIIIADQDLVGRIRRHDSMMDFSTGVIKYDSVYHFIRNEGEKAVFVTAVTNTNDFGDAVSYS